ncbi:MAG: hypothetical protein JJU05_04555 [Verrucomicrobia bacterium]|nr:hypothetical protein [Verrucomicrobiota bacterium]MCH8525603.1 hypothetical protein [Kiritimatiellia bacterium]
MSDAPPTFQPDAAERQDLVDTLRALERDPSGDSGARTRLHRWLTARNPDTAPPHLELHDLLRLAKRRQKEGEDFRLPEHLLECRVCMELFQVLCGETDARKPPEASGGGSISSAARPETPARTRPKARRWVAAAAVVLLSLFLWTYLRPPGIILESGALRQQSGTLRAGQLPARRSLEALQRTELSFLDGSRITLEPGAAIRISKTIGFQPYIVLEGGQARFDFRDAKTAPQLRSGDLIILPANAGFALDAAAEPGSLRVHRGELQAQLSGETHHLQEGESLAHP